MFNSEKFIENCKIFDMNNSPLASGSGPRREGIELGARFLVTALLEFIEKSKGSKVEVKIDSDIAQLQSNFGSKRTIDISIGDEPGKIDFPGDAEIRVKDSSGNNFLGYLSGYPGKTSDSFSGNINILSYLLDKTEGKESVSATFVSSPIVIGNGEGKIVGKGKKDYVFYGKESLDAAGYSMKNPVYPYSIDLFKNSMSNRQIDPDGNREDEPEYTESNEVISNHERSALRVLFQGLGQEVKAFSENPQGFAKD